MKRSLFFVLFLIVCLGVIVFADSSKSKRNSMLSELEMSSIIGTCHCHILTSYECRYLYDLNCTIEGSCPSQDNRYHNPIIYVAISAGTPNGLVATHNETACFTPTNTLDDGESPEYACSMQEPYPWPDETYTGYWYKCIQASPYTCTKCKWGTPSGDSTMLDYDYCEDEGA